MKPTNSADILGEDGPLATHLDGYTPRAEQQALSSAIETAIAENKILVAEAGTGTGKTFAYLIPTLLAKQKAVVSTGTKNLQDQLFHRDLPFLRKMLGQPIKVALLKGRSSYLCRYRLENVPDDKGFISKKLAAEVEKIRALAPKTKLGEISEIIGVPEDSPAWPLVTSNIDNCLGADCPAYEDCHLMKARRKAMDADVVIVNHHLLFADLNLKQKALGELLPNTKTFIIDEAHQVPEVASQFFGARVSSRQLLELIRDTQAEALEHAKDMKQIDKAGDRLKTAINDLRIAMGDTGLRAPWMSVHKQCEQATSHLLAELDFFNSLLEKASERSKGLDNCYQRCQEIRASFVELTGASPPAQIHWFETYTNSFSIHFTPISVAEEMQTHLFDEPKAWIFTSATLAVGENFNHYTDQVGLQDATCMQFSSPFDYAKQALLYVPRGLPDPNHIEYTAALVEAALPVLKASGGRAFLLFTSHRALKKAAELIIDKIDFPVLVQGDEPKAVLLDKYRELGNAVLLGTGSFWEGVDVRGEALSCVIIDKLPFSVPDDPIQKARALNISQRGGNPFVDQQIPKAVISLKQGAGRLIRDMHDNGVLMIADPRLVAKNYGQTFLQSLPPMPRTRDIAKVEVFFQKVRE